MMFIQWKLSCHFMILERTIREAKNNTLRNECRHLIHAKTSSYSFEMFSKVRMWETNSDPLKALLHKRKVLVPLIIALQFVNDHTPSMVLLCNIDNI